MGRVIDADEVKKRFPIMENDFGMVINETLHKELDKISPVEVIPKADYENRLKADMVAMLTEIQLEFEENTVRWYVGRVDGKSDDVVLMETINDIIQQKINALKGDSND